MSREHGRERCDDGPKPLSIDEQIAAMERRLMHELHHIRESQEKIMSQFTDIKDLITKLDATTTAHSVILAELRDRVKAGMTDAEVAELKAGLTQEITDLEEMGKDPSDPAPLPTPIVP